METNQVVPDIIDKAPKAVLDVNFASGVSANEGNVLTPTQVKDPPQVVWDADSSKFYTLLMTGG